jgi:hypothetical protein
LGARPAENSIQPRERIHFYGQTQSHTGQRQGLLRKNSSGEQGSEDQRLLFDRVFPTRTPGHSDRNRQRDSRPLLLVLEGAGQRLAGVEVKASATVTAADFRGLRKLKEAVGERFATGVVLYDGEATVSFGGGLFAAPIRSLWSMP